MSACVKWAKEHVDAFNAILSRQLSSVDEDSPTWKECMKQAHEHAARLREVGVDFTELIGKGIGPDQSKPKPVGLGLSA